MMVLWLVLVAAAVWLIAGGRFRPGRAEEPARRLLDERLARGELSIDEYRKMRDELK